MFFRGCSVALLNKAYEDLGNRNWHVNLVNGYAIQQINHNEIYLINDSWSEHTNIVISDSISAYCYDEYYVAVKCLSVQPTDKLNRTSTEWRIYLVDMQHDVVHGPYTPDEYQEACLNYQISDLEQWISTSPTPPEASFY